MAKLDKGIAASIVAPFFIALSILLAKMAGQHTQGLFVAGLGSFASVPVLCLFATFSRWRGLKLGVLWNQCRSPFLQVLITRAIVGQALIVLGFTMTSAVKSILLLRLEPIFVFIWSVLLLKEKATRGKLALLGLLLTGSLLVVWPGDALSAANIGDGLLLLSLLFLSYSYMPTKTVVDQSSTLGLNLLTNLIGGVVLTAIAIACCGAKAIPVTSEVWFPLCGYAFTFFVVGTSLYYFAFRSVKPWIISSFLSLEVIYGLGLAMALMHESITAMQLSGSGVLLTATLLIAAYRKREESRHL